MDHRQEDTADRRLWNSEAGQGRGCEGLQRELQEALRGRNAIAECERIPAGMLVLMAASLAGCVC